MAPAAAVEEHEELTGENTGVCNLISVSSVFVSLFVRDMGERYRREMLAHGGAKEPMLMVEGNFNLLFNLFLFPNTERIFSH